MKYKFTKTGDFKTIKTSNKTTLEHSTLSNQALGAVMMALQNSLMNQTDIVPVLKGFKFTHGPDDELIVLNPPITKTNEQDAEV